MTVSYTAGATNKDLVRMLVTDTDIAYPIFTDEEIAAFLSLNGDNAWYASATALLTIAANETLVSKRIELLDLKTDGPAEAEALRKLAADLRAMGASMDTFTIDWAEQVFDQFGFYEKLVKDSLREG